MKRLPIQTPSNSNEPSPNAANEAQPRWIVVLRSCQRHGVVVAFCSSGFLVSSAAINFALHSVNSLRSLSQQQLVSRADYELLKVGMTVTDAQAALGRAIEVSRNETTVSYKWVNIDGSEITAVFKGDRLISKEQSGLR